MLTIQCWTAETGGGRSLPASIVFLTSFRTLNDTVSKLEEKGRG